MHPFEQTMASCLEAGDEPHPDRFGGIEALTAVACNIALSPLMPEFLRMSLPLLADAQHPAEAGELICLCVEGATDAFVWTETVDLLDAVAPLPPTVAERCFTRFLAVSGERSLSPLTRAAGLDGALRWAADDRRRQLRLSLALLDVTADDDATFLARAAKIMGVAYSHWREQGLLDSLLVLSNTDRAADEAAFELGMAKVAEGLDANSRAVAAESFSKAHQWFERADAVREQRPDARLYACCLETLVCFSEGARADRVGSLVESLAKEVFTLHAWHRAADNPSWLGARHAEAVSWEMLALTLKKLAGHLDLSAWWEPPAVIEQHLLTAYCLLRRAGDFETESLRRH